VALNSWDRFQRSQNVLDACGSFPWCGPNSYTVGFFLGWKILAILHKALRETWKNVLFFFSVKFFFREKIFCLLLQFFEFWKKKEKTLKPIIYLSFLHTKSNRSRILNLFLNWQIRKKFLFAFFPCIPILFCHHS
jgi:hypothetical protein